MAAPRVGEHLVVQDPLEGPEQDSGQVALLLTLKRQNFVQLNIVCIRNWNRNFSKVGSGTGTAINHHVSTTHDTRLIFI
jgi:hypothetical protein